MSKEPKFLVDSVGYSEGTGRYQFIGTAQSLKELSEALDRLSHLSNGAMIDIPIAPKGKWGGYVLLAFAKCSTEKFEEIHANRRRVGLFERLFEKIAGPFVFFLLLICVVLGLVQVVRYFGMLVLWIVGKV